MFYSKRLSIGWSWTRSIATRLLRVGPHPIVINSLSLSAFIPLFMLNLFSPRPPANKSVNAMALSVLASPSPLGYRHRQGAAVEKASSRMTEPSVCNRLSVGGAGALVSRPLRWRQTFKGGLERQRSGGGRALSRAAAAGGGGKGPAGGGGGGAPDLISGGGGGRSWVQQQQRWSVFFFHSSLLL
jgi:hypothetical protein